MRRGALGDLNLTSKGRLLRNVKLKESLVWSDDEKVEIEILREASEQVVQQCDGLSVSPPHLVR